MGVRSCGRSKWPDALLLVLPRPAETAIGYSRWVVQRICSASSSHGLNLRLPFVWMAVGSLRTMRFAGREAQDDLLLSFYRAWARGVRL